MWIIFGPLKTLPRSSKSCGCETFRVLKYLLSKFLHYTHPFHMILSKKSVVSCLVGWFIGVLRHRQRYFSHICDGTDVHAEWRRGCTYGRASDAIDISYGPLTCPSYTDTGPPFLYGDSDTPPHLVAFYDTLGIRRTYSRLNPPPPPRRPHGGVVSC